MSLKILITGATSGIGLQTAQALLGQGHQVLIHGRSPKKLAETEAALKRLGQGTVQTLCCDLSKLAEVHEWSQTLGQTLGHLDVLINNAGVFAAPNNRTEEGLDLRFAVNTFAPYLLAQGLRSSMSAQGRVVNLSSAAQAPTTQAALTGAQVLDDGAAYAQSKLALTAWSHQLAAQRGSDDPLNVSVNPGSMLGSKMVQEAFGVAGRDIQIGAKILVQAATDPSFANANGLYFDNDSGHFAAPHPAAHDPEQAAKVVSWMRAWLESRALN